MKDDKDNRTVSIEIVTANLGHLLGKEPVDTQSWQPFGMFYSPKGYTSNDGNSPEMIYQPISTNQD